MEAQKCSAELWSCAIKPKFRGLALSHGGKVSLPHAAKKGCVSQLAQVSTKKNLLLFISQILAALYRCADDVTKTEVKQALMVSVGEGEDLEMWATKMLTPKKDH